MKKLFFTLILAATYLSLTFVSCKKTVVNNDPTTGKLQINFQNYVDGSPAIFDTMIYINAAGNHYLVSDVQYFISDVTLYKHGGNSTMIKGWVDYHYIDSQIPSSLVWNVYDDINIGDYDSLAFHFGISSDKNITGMFVNFPEKDMSWPDVIGGGYHYMKLNGKWLDVNNIKAGFGFHLGIGQNYDSLGNVILPFIDNSFRVSLPSSSFTISGGVTTNINIRMNFEKWFKEPNIYDLNYWGGGIMQNQGAQKVAAENGWNVFSFSK